MPVVDAPLTRASAAEAPLWDSYRAFRTACSRATTHMPDREVVRLTGTGGATPARTARGGCLVVGADAAEGGRLEQALLEALPEWVLVLPEAGASAVRRVGTLGWTERERYRAMQRRRLAAHPYVLPSTLAVRRISLTPDAPDDLLAPALRLAAPDQQCKESLVADVASTVLLLHALTDVHLFGAVDPSGQLVATAGVRVVAGGALVCSVATERSWRRQGVATAMTTVVLNAALDAGARYAFLDSTAQAQRVYRRLGFEDLGPVVHCYRPQPAD